MHVFPAVDTSAADAAAAAAAAAGAAPSAAPAEEQVLTCTLEALQKAAPRRLVSFSQKQALLRHLKAAAARVADCEAKLARLETLTDDGQRLYDTATSLAEKTTWVTAQMEAQLEAGQLTKAEQEAVLSQLAAKVSDAQAAAAAAKAEGKDAKAQKLDGVLATMLARRDAVAGAKPVTHAVKYEKARLDVFVVGTKSRLALSPPTFALNAGAASAPCAAGGA